MWAHTVRMIMVVALLAVFAIPTGAVQVATDDERAEMFGTSRARDDRSTLDSTLLALARQTDAKGQAAVASEPAERVEVQVRLRDRSGFASGVEALGGEVTAQRGEAALVEISSNQLRRLAALSSVVSVRTPNRPIPLIQSEGVAESGGDDWTADGFDGTGVKVAIVDLSFRDYTVAQTQGELPAALQTVNFCGSFSGADPHGTAVAEIVHDMAPAAQLALICVDDFFALEDATDWMIANGVDVVVHSVAWPNSGRGDGTQPEPSPSNAVKRADAAGLLWVNAAGNFAQDHYGAPFTPLQFSGRTVHNFGGGDPDMNIVVQAGTAIEVVFKYDGWPTTTDDFDMELFDLNNNSLAGSFNDQTVGAEPIESLVWVNDTGSDSTVFLELQEWSATGRPEMDIFVFGHSGIQYNTAARSIVEPASSPYAVGVGAVCWSTDQLEPFSSQGPTIDGRTKPDIVAADGVSTFGFGETIDGNCFTSFPGTSASAPHVGGAAALVLDARPHFTGDEVLSFLLLRAKDRGSVGPDNMYGSGELKMGVPVSYFVDTSTSIFEADIEWLLEQGITTGCSAVPPAFCPTDTISRGQMAAFLNRALNLPSTTQDFFTDDDGTTFEADINRLAASGITTGCTPTTYCPTASVTRAQMASFLVRAFDLPATPVDFFTDDDGTTHEANINRLAAAAVTGGCGIPDSYCPTNNVTRGQMAAFLRRAMTE